MKEVLLVLVGALGTLGASQFGAHRESKREHERWLRDHRLEIWGQLMVAVGAAFDLDRPDVGVDLERLTPEQADNIHASAVRAGEVFSSISRASVAAVMLGPGTVSEAAAEVSRHASKTLDAGISHADFAAASNALDDASANFAGLAAELIQRP